MKHNPNIIGRRVQMYLVQVVYVDMSLEDHLGRPLKDLAGSSSWRRLRPSARRQAAADAAFVLPLRQHAAAYDPS